MSKVITKSSLTPEEKKHLPVLKQSDNPKEIQLSGIAITESGKLTKHKYFEFLNMEIDDYSDLSFTQEEAIKIRGHLAKMSTGHTSMVPMICSPKCPFRNRCVFFQMNKAPFGRSCLIEKNLITEWTTSYINQYDIDPNNFTEISMVNELAEIEVYLWRLSQSLAKPENAELIEEINIGFTPDGVPLTNRQISTLLEAKEKLYSRRARIVKLMVGDRQEKYKKEAALKTREESDPSNSMSELRSRLERLSRDVRKRELDIAEASGQLIDINPVEEQKTLSPEDIINGDD